jgi:microcystin-dependent protein
MSQPFVGEIRMFGGNFAPVGWAFCDGALMPISENDVLFTLIGTTYGGDGQSTFALPDFRGRVPLHQGQAAGGSNHVIGENAGSETVTLGTNQIPSHTHAVNASGAVPPPAVSAVNVTGVDTTWVPASPVPKPKLYGAAGGLVPMAPNSVQVAGGSQPHDNMAPYLAVNFIISLFGIFPSQN